MTSSTMADVQAGHQAPFRRTGRRRAHIGGALAGATADCGAVSTHAGRQAGARSGTPSKRDSGRAISSAWLKPRSTSRRRPSGTGPAGAGRAWPRRCRAARRRAASRRTSRRQRQAGAKFQLQQQLVDGRLVIDGGDGGVRRRAAGADSVRTAAPTSPSGLAQRRQRRRSSPRYAPRQGEHSTCGQPMPHSAHWAGSTVAPSHWRSACQAASRRGWVAVRIAMASFHVHCRHYLTSPVSTCQFPPIRPK